MSFYEAIRTFVRESRNVNPAVGFGFFVDGESNKKNALLNHDKYFLVLLPLCDSLGVLCCALFVTPLSWENVMLQGIIRNIGLES